MSHWNRISPDLGGLVMALAAILLLEPGCDRSPTIEQRTVSQADVEAVHLVLLDDGWRVSVTVSHDDSGWDHYADWWRITDRSGRELARRVLRHPHIEEQPFTRSLDSVALPPDTGTVVVEAHCSVHGTGGRVVTVDLERNKGPGYSIQR